MPEYYAYVTPSHGSLAVLTASRDNDNDNDSDTVGSGNWAKFSGSVKVIYTKYDDDVNDGSGSNDYTITVVDYDALDGDYLSVNGTTVYFAVGTTNAETAGYVDTALDNAGFTSSYSGAVVTLVGVDTCTTTDSTNLTVVGSSSSENSPSFPSRYHLALAWGALSIMGFGQYEAKFMEEIRNARATKSARPTHQIKQYHY